MENIEEAAHLIATHKIQMKADIWTVSYNRVLYDCCIFIIYYFVFSDGVDFHPLLQLETCACLALLFSLPFTNKAQTSCFSVLIFVLEVNHLNTPV